jgi:hypothetical protein
MENRQEARNKGKSGRNNSLKFLPIFVKVSSYLGSKNDNF